MIIIHTLNDFLFTLFPDVENGDIEKLKEALLRYYSYGPFVPKIEVKDDAVLVDIDVAAIAAQDGEFQKAVTLCEKGKYEDAKPILMRLIEKNPTNSEFHRIMGQIHSEEGRQDDAIDFLIDALRWNPKNGWALLMMGNIFFKYKNDMATAMKYFDQALIANPNDPISMTNIGVNLMQDGKLEEAEKYLLEALKIDNDYPNAHFAMAMIAEKQHDPDSAFYSYVKALKLNSKKDELYQNSLKKAFDTAKKMVADIYGKKIYREYRQKLEFEGLKEIDIVEDPDINTAAKIEFAENYDRPNHLVRYKPGYPAVEHLIMHELVHLDLVIQARKEKINQLFVSNPKQKTAFINGLDQTIKKLRELGVDEEAVATYCSSLFEGINSQVYNTPIDLFIEHFLYNEYPPLRPFQFLSLYHLLQENIKAVTDKNILYISPREITAKSKIYSLVNAMQFRDLYGIDMIPDFQSTPAEMKTATSFYNEFLDYRDDKEPAEEYELVLHWAEDLKLDQNFSLVNETDFRAKRTGITNTQTPLKNDPYNFKSKGNVKDWEMEKFLKSEATIGTNTAVVMFMIDALQFFDGMETPAIKKIAVEIAMQGIHGYRPEKKDYTLSSIPDKTFTGYHILAYYYVSWALSDPMMLPKLGLPYEEEYKVAMRMREKPDPLTP